MAAASTHDAAGTHGSRPKMKIRSMNANTIVATTDGTRERVNEAAMGARDSSVTATTTATPRMLRSAM
jgi:hypothetical protein